jgi:hypothetical protein
VTYQHWDINIVWSPDGHNSRSAAVRCMDRPLIPFTCAEHIESWICPYYAVFSSVSPDL